MAKSQSSSRKIPFAEELTLYLIHGWLHLVGFNDKEKIERQQMRLEEENCLTYVDKLNLWPDFMLAENETGR